MADARKLSAALAPFRHCRNMLQSAQARLSGLLAACTRDGVTRIERLSGLPAAAQFTPFDALSTPGGQAGAGTSAPQTAPGRLRATGHNAAALSAANRGPASAGPAGFVRQALANVSAAPASQISPRAPGQRKAPAMNIDTPTNTSAPPAARGAAALQTGAIERVTRACDAGELIDALLQRHAAPRHPARLHGIGARPTAAQALSGADDAAVGQATRLGAALASATPAAWANRDTTPAQQPSAETAPDVATDRAAFGPVSSPRMRETPMSADTAPARDTSDTNMPGPASLLQTGGNTLRALVTPLFLRPTPGAEPAANAAGSSPSRPDRLPVLRSPSRLLAAAHTASAGAATPTAGAKAGTAPPAFATTAPTLAMDTDSAADSHTDFAAGLDRLLREQAWLRGVDLT